MAFTAPTRTITMTAEDVATLDWYAENVAQDQVFNATPLLRLLAGPMKQPGLVGPDVAALFNRVRPMSPRKKTQGGIRAELPLAYGQSTNTTAFRRGQTLPVNIDEGLTRAESLFAYYTDYCALYKQDEWENSGPGKALNRKQEQLDMMFRSFANLIATDLYGSQTDVASGQPKVPGIQHLISTSPTSGTVWGITRSSPNTFWRNNADTVGSFATNGLDKLRTMRNSCSGNGGLDAPSLYITTSAVWGYCVKQLEGIHRVTSPDFQPTPDLASTMVMHMGSPIIWDNSCPAGYLYMLNLNYLMVIMQENAVNYLEHPATPNDRLVAEQTRIATGLTWGGTRYDRQGVLSGITA